MRTAPNGIGFRVLVGVDDGLAVSDGVGVKVGLCEGVSVSDLVLVAVVVGEGVNVWDAVGVDEFVGEGDFVGEGEGVGEDVYVMLAVDVGVGMENQTELAYLGVPGMGSPRLSWP